MQSYCPNHLQLNLTKPINQTTMRQLNIPSLPAYATHQLPQLGVLTHVDELTKFDLIYCFHFMKENDSLELRQDTERFWDSHAVCVYFNSFKIGYLSQRTAQLVKRHLSKGKSIKAAVKNLHHQYRMPFHNLDIQITVYP
jgi:hypothetical protein